MHLRIIWILTRPAENCDSDAEFHLPKGLHRQPLVSFCQDEDISSHSFFNSATEKSHKTSPTYSSSDLVWNPSARIFPETAG